MTTEHFISGSSFSNIYYKKQGKGNVLFLLHGFPENHTLWGGIVSNLAHHFTVITPDIPGSGKSILENETISVEALAEAVKAIMDHEKITKMVIGGHSLGGYVALAFAEKYASYLKGLSLIHSTATADSDEKKIKRKKTIDIVQKGGKNAFIKEMIPALFSEQFRNEKKAIIEKQIEKGKELSDKSIVAFYTAMMNRKDRTTIFKNTTFPFQMIIGKEETIAPMNVLIEQAVLADVGFIHLYENVLHMSMLEQPQRLTNDLINFTNYCFNRH